MHLGGHDGGSVRGRVSGVRLDDEQEHVVVEVVRVGGAVRRRIDHQVHRKLLDRLLHRHTERDNMVFLRVFSKGLKRLKSKLLAWFA